uniref:Uncharacterized protein n=1 Tax=Oryza barthii TaxID=65489 RepID=A0A0D3FWH8_9ORYZ
MASEKARNWIKQTGAASHFLPTILFARQIKGITISMEKLFPITQVMGNEENRAATEEFIACCHGDGYPTIVEQSGSKIVGDVMYGDENVEELTDGEEDARDQSASEGLRGENLAPLPVLATATPSNAIHLLEGVAFGALISTPLQGNSPGENLRFVRIGRCRRSVSITFLKDSF